MKRLLWILWLLPVVVGFQAVPGMAQGSDFTIVYDETRSAFFEGEEFTQNWIFFGEARDMLSIRAYRIAGQFTPRLRLLDARGNEIAASTGEAFTDTDSLTYLDGLPETGPYQIEVSGIDVSANQTDNPAEYSLTLTRQGQRREDVSAGLTPLPRLAPVPEIENDTPELTEIGLDVYGATPDVVRSDTPNISVRYLFTTPQNELRVNNVAPLQNGVRSVAFVAGGIGLIVNNERLAEPVPFFSDTDFLAAYNATTGVYTFTLDNDTTIITDFYRIQSLQSRGDVVEAVMVRDGNTRRFIFTGELIDLRRSGGQGEGEASLNEIRLENDGFISTDLNGFQTLAYLDGQLRVLFNQMDGRFISDIVQIPVLRQADDGTTNISLRVPADDDTTRLLNMSINWRGMGDVRVNGADDESPASLDVLPLDGRTLSEPLTTVETLLIENRHVRYARTDGTYLTSLVDGTRISTPADLPDNPDVYPHQADYRPRNFNNLGTGHFPLCPCVDDTLENQPVNPANGNFYYAVTDFHIPGHTLELNLTRYYNSQDTGLTPDYLLDSPAGYWSGQMGDGWRHSYQYELDVRGAPAGRVRLILPDGTQHLFFASAADATRYSSRTLLGWSMQRSADVIGTWQIARTDGITLHFDRAGRLERLSETPDRNLMLSPVPLTPQYQALGTQGVFITEPYGRRLELYAADDGRVRLARDTSARQITYQYTGDDLTGVEYITPTQTAQYEYDNPGLLSRITDARSPYHPVATLEYDAQRRVSRYQENPDGSQSRLFEYVYQHTDSERLTTRRTQVNGTDRTVAWQYNNLWQLTRRTTPREGYDFEYTYDATTGILTSIRQPNLTRYLYEFNARGELTRFEDPFLAGSGGYVFNYEQRGNQNLLTEIRYPNNGIDTFIWSEGDDPQLIAHQQLVTVNSTGRILRETRYERDEWGRLTMVIQPDNTATVYTYDAFGYVSEIWQGVTLQPGETRADITDSSRARRVLQVDYDLIGQVRAVTDGRGGTYTLNWDSSTEQLRQVNGPLGVSRSYTYDEFGRVTLVNDRGQETSYTYNPSGYVESITSAAGIVTTFTYDEAGNLLSTVDDLQRETRYSYDELNNLTRRVSPAGQVTTYETVIAEDGDFTVRRELDAAGREIVRRYDALGRLRRYTITEGDFQQEYRLEYNLLNYPTQITESLGGRSLGLEYNLIGDVQAINAAGARTEFTYNEAGKLIEVISPGERVTAYTYDPLGNVTDVQLPDGDTIGYNYDENSNLLDRTDPGGLVTTYVYDALNQVISEEDPAGNNTSYFYDARGNLITRIDPREIGQSFEYDALDRLTGFTDGRGQTTTYEYDDVGRLFNIQKPGVRSTRFTYDADDNIIAVTERPREQRTLYSYDRVGRVNSITDSLGHTRTYIYYALDRVNRIIDPIGNEERYGWRNGTLNLARYTDTAGRSHEFNTDALGRVTTIRDVTTEQNVALNTQFSYDADGYIRSIQTGTDQARVSGINDILHQYTYSPRGLLLEYTDPSDGTWQMTYDDSGRLTEVISPRDVTTRYIYDDAGNIIEVINHAGTESEAIERYQYDANDNVTQYTSPGGVVNSYTYDPNNRLIQARLAVDTDVESRYVFEYNGVGQLVRTEDPMGNITRYFYLLDNLTRVERELDDDTTIATGYNYDDAGNLRNIVLPARNTDENALTTITLTYDALDRRVRYVNGEDNVWSYTYDAAGNISQISDPLGSVVQYDYDTYDRVQRIQYPTGSVVNLSYDTAGNLRTITLPPNDNGQRQVVTYTLDVTGNVTEMQTGGTITRYEYDTRGNLIRRVAPDGTVTTYEYDAAGRLQAMVYPDERVEYAYDADGHLIQAGDMQFEYDALGRVQRALGTLEIAYEYDLAGNLLRRDAGSAGTVNYTYDALYRPVQLQYNGETVDVVYDNLGQIRQILRSNGVRTVLSYDAAGRVISILHLGPGNERLDGFNYQYDAVGNLIRADRITDGWRILYSYDVAHRLIDERWLNEFGETVYTVGFRYDDTGNRVEELRNGRRTLFQYDAQNRLVGEVRDYAPQDNFIWQPLLLALFVGSAGAYRRRRRYLLLAGVLLLMAGLASAAPPMQPNTTVNRVRYEYNPAGNLARAVYETGQAGESYELRFEYDNEQRLTRVQGQDDAGHDIDTELTYDILSRLVEWRSSPDDDYRLHYDGHQLLGMEDLTSEAQDIDRFLNLAGQRLLSVDAEADAEYWHLNDLQGSTRRYAGSSGNLITDPARLLEFSSFGVRIYPYSGGIRPENASVEQPTPFYAGYLYDPSTQMYQMGLRTYDPTVARFLQPDPIRQDPIGTLYTYARNRPFVFSDRYGMTVAPFVEPTEAVNLGERLQPETLIERPALPDIPEPPRVHELQADETFRTLELLDMTYYGTNQAVVRLSPLLNDMYLYRANPMPQAMKSLSAAPLNDIMSLYTSGDGWLPNPAPQPFNPREPFQVLQNTESLLARAYVDPLQWCNFGDTHPVSTAILPDVTRPQGLSTQYQLESRLLTTLQPVPMMDALEPQTDALRDVFPQSVAPDMTLPSVDVPDVRVEPPILHSLDHLREETFDLTRHLLPPVLRDCENCAPALTFSQ